MPICFRENFYIYSCISKGPMSDLTRCIKYYNLWLPNSYCGLNSSGDRGANDLVSENFRHVTGHYSSVRNQNFGRPGHRSHCVRTARNGTVDWKTLTM